MGSQTTPDRKHSARELRQAGASELLVSVYFTEYGGRHSVVSEIDNGPFDLDQLNENPNLGGHFFAAVWEGREQDAFNRADLNNRDIMQEATA